MAFSILEAPSQEQNRIWSVHYIQISTIKKEKMAFYVFMGNNNGFPFFYNQNVSMMPQPNFSSSFYSMENLPSLTSVQQPIPPTAFKPTTLELPTIAPEESNRSSHEEARGRKKREKNLQRQLVSAKKNSQSNIINHFFTYFTARDCSQAVVRKAITALGKNTSELEKIIPIFYQTIRLINNKRGRKYINKTILWHYFTEEWLLESLDKLETVQELSVAELSSILRRCLYCFMNEISLNSILTSKRITTHSKEIHLSKRRKINSFFRGLSNNY